MRRVWERPRTSTPSDFQENGCWKMRWPRSPAKNRPSGRPPPSAARKRSSATPRSCASSTTAKSKGACPSAAAVGGQSREDVRPGDSALRSSSPSRTRSKIAHSTSRCLPPSRVLRRAARRRGRPPRSRAARRRRPRSTRRAGTAAEKLMPPDLAAALAQQRPRSASRGRDAAAGRTRSVERRSRRRRSTGRRSGSASAGSLPTRLAELGPQRVRQRLGEGRQQHARVGIRRARCTARCSATMVLPVPAEPATRAGPADRSARPAARCAGCRKTAHFSHGIVERALQLLDVGQDAEAPLRVGMGEGIGLGRRRLRRHAASRRPPAPAAPPAPPAAGASITSSRLSSVACADVVDPLLRHAESHQLELAQIVEQRRLGAAASVGASAAVERLARRSPRPAPASRPAAPRRSSDGVRSCGARPSCRRRRGGRRSTSSRLASVRCTISRMSAFTRTDQKFGSLARSSLWNAGPGRGGRSAGRRPWS